MPDAEEDETRNHAYLLGLGAAATVGGFAVSYPFDTIRKRFMLMGPQHGHFQ